MRQSERILLWITIGFLLVVQVFSLLGEHPEVVAPQVGTDPERIQESAGAPMTSSDAVGFSGLAARLEMFEQRIAGIERELGQGAAVRTELAGEASMPRVELQKLLRTLRTERAARQKHLRDLRGAILRDDRAEVARILRWVSDVDARDDDGNTALCYAAVHARDAIVRMLHKRGADLGIPSARGMTPLLASLEGAHDSTAQLLLDLGGDPRAVDSNGQSALIWASFNGLDKVVARLLKLDVDINQAGHDGNSALHDAAHAGRLNIAKLLVSHGASLEAKTRGGVTPLGMAVQKGRRDVAEYLRSRGAR